MNKITSIAIKNFQSLKYVEVPLGQFTAVVGASNLGKSAILRAIKATAKNASAPGLVREGEKEFYVGVAFDDAFSVSLAKGSKRSEFSIVDDEGLEYSFPKAGASSVPDEVAEFWHLSDLTFTSQHDKPFLLAEPPSEVARVLGDLTNASLLMEAVREANRLRTEALNDEKTRHREAQECKTQIMEFKGLKTRLESLAQARELLETMKSINNTYYDLKKIVESRATLESHISYLSSKLEAEGSVRTFHEQLEYIQIVQRSIENYERIKSKIDLENQRLRKLKEELKSIEATIHNLVEKAGTCPLCGQEIN